MTVDPLGEATSACHAVDVVLALHRSEREGRWIEVDSRL
jgi:hypothetical protein